MEPITWTITEASGQVTRQGNKMPHKQPFDLTDKTPKGQVPVIEGWNEMRQCLIDNGLMESQ